MSSRWIARQGADAYVKARNRLGLRSRSAFKLMEIDDQHRFLKEGPCVDLGAAPGGWAQVAVRRSKYVIMSDILEIEPLPDTKFILGDFLCPDVRAAILKEANRKGCKSVICDMAPNCCGDTTADHDRQIRLADHALQLAKEILRPGEGTVLLKVFTGAQDKALEMDMRKHFKEFKRVKPKSCRKNSREIFFLAKSLREVSNKQLLDPEE